MQSEKLGYELDSRRNRLANRALAVACALSLMTAVFAVVAWRSAPDVVQAKKFEVVDADGKVRARMETGLICLYNKAGTQKARLTSDENNGNIVLFGEGGKRLEVFMDPTTPRVCFYNEKGEPFMLIPPP